MPDDLYAHLDELVDTDPLRLREEAFVLLHRAERAEAELERLRADWQDLWAERNSLRDTHGRARALATYWRDGDFLPAYSRALFAALDLTPDGQARTPADTCGHATVRPLLAAIECVLLDHADQIDGDNADPNLSELAYVYRQQTGWAVDDPDHPADTTEQA